MESILLEYAPRCYNTLVARLNLPVTKAGNSWAAEYRIAGFLSDSEKYVEKFRLTDAGRFSLQCSKKSDRIELLVSHLNLAHPADSGRISARISCLDNELYTPLDWDYTQRFERQFDQETLTGLDETGVVRNEIVFCNEHRMSPKTFSGPYTSDYSLFAAMPKLVLQGKYPCSFDMLETLLVMRRYQSIVSSGKIVLRDGRVLREFVQQGDGILIWFWWLDENGIPAVCVREHHVFMLEFFKETA